ncbi:cytoplasmic protein [Salinisphaera aquimarina]|uniref:Cytoplasmic protein n=1 Tax=Salinisphaera aquimarina TaxID=2094031 RepID=A0ABV7EQG5_9GAMM
MYSLSTLHRLHETSSNHRELILNSIQLGCFHCCKQFSPEALDEWWDEDANGIGQTAVCPYCGIDTVVGDAAGHRITEQLLAALRDHFFWRICS